MNADCADQTRDLMIFFLKSLRLCAFAGISFFLPQRRKDAKDLSGLLSCIGFNPRNPRRSAAKKFPANKKPGPLKDLAKDCKFIRFLSSAGG
jgi:hypothetical protein